MKENTDQILKNIDDKIQEQETYRDIHQNLVSTYQENINNLYVTRGQVEGSLQKPELFDTNKYFKRRTLKNGQQRSGNNGTRELILTTLTDFGNPCDSVALFKMFRNRSTVSITRKNFNHAINRLCKYVVPAKLIALTAEGIKTDNPHYKPRYYALSEWVDDDKLKEGFVIGKNLVKQKKSGEGNTISQKILVFQALEKYGRPCQLGKLFELLAEHKIIRQCINSSLLLLTKDVIKFRSPEHSKFYYFALREWMDGDKPKEEFAIK